MSTVKISQLPELPSIAANTSNSLFIGVDLATGTTGKFTATTLAEQLYANNYLRVGFYEGTYPNAVSIMAGSSNNYIQSVFENIEGQGTTDIVVQTLVSTDTTNFIDLGYAGADFTPGAFNSLGTSTHKLDGYLYVQGDTPEGPGGNLVIGTSTTEKVIRFVAGGIDVSNIVMTLTSTGPSINSGSHLTFGDGSTQHVAAAPANYTQSAFDIANTATENISIIEGVDVTQNTRLSVIEGTNTTQNANITAVNQFAAGAYDTANTNATNITDVNNYASSGYAKANAAVANTTTINLPGELTVTGNLNLNGINHNFVSSSFSSDHPLVQITGADNGAYVNPSNSYYMLQVTGKSNNVTRVVLDSFGANAYPVLIGRMGRGSAAAPAATANNDVMMRVVGNGYTGTQFPSSSPTKIDFVAAENFTDSARGTQIQFWNTPNGSNTIQKIASFNANEVQFTGTVNPQKGFIFSPTIVSGNTTSYTVDIANTSFIKLTTNDDCAITLSDYQAGKLVEVWLTNLSGSNKTVTHGCLALNSTTNSTTFTIPATSSAHIKYMSFDGDNANTFVKVSHA